MIVFAAVRGHACLLAPPREGVRQRGVRHIQRRSACVKLPSARSELAGVRASVLKHAFTHAPSPCVVPPRRVLRRRRVDHSVSRIVIWWVAHLLHEGIRRELNVS